MGQVVGLQSIIDSLSNRVSALESIVPNLGAVSSSSTSGTYTIPIPAISEVLFLPSSAGTVFSDSGLDVTKLSSRAPCYAGTRKAVSDDQSVTIKALDGSLHQITRVQFHELLIRAGDYYLSLWGTLQQKKAAL